MSRLFLGGETIGVDLDAKGNPIRFTWLGQPYAVDHIYQHREVDMAWWSEEGPTHRDIFALTTTDGMLCVIHFDHLDGYWHLEKMYD